MKNKFFFFVYFIFAIAALIYSFTGTTDPSISQFLRALALISLLLAARTQSKNEHSHLNQNMTNEHNDAI